MSLTVLLLRRKEVIEMNQERMTALSETRAVKVEVAMEIILLEKKKATTEMMEVVVIGVMMKVITGIVQTTEER